MNITLNGQPRTIPGRMFLRDLVTQFSKTPEVVIAEVNGAIIPKEDWASTQMNPEDRIELVAFVGGG
ncbi:MAG: sulfur carrier protein ThiS [Candidatus Omnitrophica bacterium]|nr:sulfur carrier protein ThiS [Candidatus Omnitrophota bacterium]